MALAKDAHQWALVAAVILEEQKGIMSHSISQECSTSCAAPPVIDAPPALGGPGPWDGKRKVSR